MLVIGYGVMTQSGIRGFNIWKVYELAVKLEGVFTASFMLSLYHYDKHFLVVTTASFPPQLTMSTTEMILMIRNNSQNQQNCNTDPISLHYCVRVHVYIYVLFCY